VLRLHSLYVEYTPLLPHLTGPLTKSSVSARSRLTFFHNPLSPSDDPGRHTHVPSLFSHLIYKDLLSKVSAPDLLQTVGLHSESRPEQQTLLGILSSLEEITGDLMLADTDKDDYRRFVEASILVAKKVGLAPGASGLVINGRVRLFVVRHFRQS
jgi:hypothetical protein